MDYVWQNPEAGHVKINVHCITLPQPLPNGNSVGVRAVVRNQKGKELWSAAGPMNGRSKLQATLWGIYYGALHCHQIKEWKTQIETDHWDTTERTITRIPVGQNSTVVFLARFGMENMKVFAETPGSFGEKQYWLDRDMGLLFSSAPPANYDLGEVIDADVPSSPVALMLNRANTEVVHAASSMWSFLSLPKRVCKAIYAWF
ncbi:hypothetical protein DCAR_0311481 [Daucus carota subsp. sativus]|uniref:Uncharacterized protein n=1 Tax=Daucus carota subsp. sativus TaxID=79200 RepID=A0A166AKP7_DAUCS|nr:hypothetical protein DCAR_0311481 [Daucus carota subsp. sativus]